MKNKLTQRQENFCLAYIKIGCATEAYRQSYSTQGMKDATVWRHATATMDRPQVVQRIAELREKIAVHASVTQAQVLDELAAHAFYDPAHLVLVNSPEDVAKLPAKIRQCIIGWSWDRQGNFVLKLANKTVALELIGKHLGMFVDRKEIRVGELERLDDTALNVRIAQAAAQVAQIEGVAVDALLRQMNTTKDAGVQTMH